MTTERKTIKLPSGISLTFHCKGLDVLAVEHAPNPLRNLVGTHRREGHRDDSNLPRLTTRKVNKELQRLGFNAELHQGNGYLYFTGPDFDTLPSASVAVCWLNDHDLEGWIAEAYYLLWWNAELA